jgi:hypothetical protein
MSRPALASIRDNAIASRSLMPSADRWFERLSSCSAAAIRSDTGPLPVHLSAIPARRPETVGAHQLAHAALRPPPRRRKLNAPRQPDRPRHQRGERKPDHHRLYHVRLHEHPHGDRSRDNGRLQRQLASGHYSAG